MYVGLCINRHTESESKRVGTSVGSVAVLQHCIEKSCKCMQCGMNCLVVGEECRLMDIQPAAECRRLAEERPPVHLYASIPPEDELQPRSEQTSSALPDQLAESEVTFSKELIAFSLYGKIDPKSKRPWNESLSTRIAEVQESFKNIPPMLYFSPSSVSFDGIGVYAAEKLPQDTMLGPYLGKSVYLTEGNIHNDGLWEVYHSDSSLAHFVDARDPKFGNWMNFIQCARSSSEQNLRLVQYSTNIYYVVTRDISVGDELLVWYDEHQYSVYMGLPTGFRPLHEKPPAGPMRYPQTSGMLSHTNQTDSTSLVQHQPESCDPAVSSHAPASGLLDSTSTDDSGLCGSLETSEGSSFTGSYECSYGNAPPHLESSPVKSSQLTYHFSASSSTESVSETGRWGVAAPSSSPAGWLQHGVTQYEVSGESPSKKQLLYGMFSRSGDGTRWQCEECKRLFSSQGSLRAHARIHTGERPYQCQYCFRTFCQASTLRSHERLHTGEKPYKCGHCGRAFTQSAGLRSHLKTHRYD